MGVTRIVTVVLAAGALAAPMASPVAAVDGSHLTAKVKKAKITGWSTRPVSLVAGEKWRAKLRAKGSKEVKLQIKASGPFRTVKTYRLKKSGRVTVAHKFASPGSFKARVIAVAPGAGKDVKSKPVTITVLAYRYQGTFGGTHTSGTSWDGTVSYYYEVRDPYTNTPWQDGMVHYTAIDGTVTWQYDPSVLNGPTRRNCSATPLSGQLALDMLDANMTVDEDVSDYGGRRYRLNVTVPSDMSPRIEYTCQYESLDWASETRTTSLQFGPNSGDLLTNSLSVDATGIDGQYVRNPAAPLVGDIRNPPEAITNRWYWNLAAG